MPPRARLKVIQGFGKDEIHTFVLGAVTPNTKLVTDDWPSYNDIPDIKHKAVTVGPMAAHIGSVSGLCRGETGRTQQVFLWR